MSRGGGEAVSLIDVHDLRVDFPVRAGGGFFRKTQQLHAVDGVSFTIAQGETLGLVGESGCGKSTTGRAVLQLLRPSSGSVTFDGLSLTELWQRRFGTPVWSEQLRSLRRQMQMIFQDPYASLNPRMTVEDIVAEPLRTFQSVPAQQIAPRVMELLEQVGLDPRFRKRYPHEFSGGQRQRIGIARAIALKPRFIVCDEPISALDVSIQAQIMNLLVELRRSYGLTYLFIAHDLAAVRHISDRIAVMYLGKIVEIADSAELCARPLHPYTQGLIAAVPVADPKRERSRTRLPMLGELPSPLRPPSGCRFHPRCPIAIARCSRDVPQLLQVHGAPLTRFAACHVVHAASDAAVST
jgi:oligopeptide transport system ATP-binding protein